MRAVSDRAGITLVELLIVLVIGVILLVSGTRTLVAKQQQSTFQSAGIKIRQALRSGSSLLFTELRGISGGGLDLRTMATDSLGARRMDGLGVVCATDTTNPDRLTVERFGSWLEEGDSVFVFREGDQNMSSDDGWLAGMIGPVDTTAACSGRPAQVMQVPEVGAAVLAGQVRVGAPVRSFTYVAYRLTQRDSASYLSVREGAGSYQLLTGPLLQDVGLEFRYLDDVGGTATAPAEVAVIEFVLRGGTDVRDQAGELVRDSVTTRVRLRN